MTRLQAEDATQFHRHRMSEQVQYQISGRRRLISQRGEVDLEPGDFVQIPRGCAFSSRCEGPSGYISLLSLAPLRRVAEVSRRAEERGSIAHGPARV